MTSERKLKRFIKEYMALVRKHKLFISHTWYDKAMVCETFGESHILGHEKDLIDTSPAYEKPKRRRK